RGAVRDAPRRAGPARGALVAHQAPRFPPAAAGPPGDQPRAPAPPAKKRGFALRRVQRKLTSTDPRRRAILARIRACWRHRPRGGVLLFFDVQPITVKAYGGRRYTRARRLVLARHQKIRGRVYPVTPYEGNPRPPPLALYPPQAAAAASPFPPPGRRPAPPP